MFLWFAGWRGGSVKGGKHSRRSIGHGDVLVVYGPPYNKAEATFQVWFADDATGVGTLVNLKQWWSSISTIGPLFGYHPNAAKTCLVVRNEQEEAAKEIFDGTGINITTEGKKHCSTY